MLWLLRSLQTGPNFWQNRPSSAAETLALRNEKLKNLTESVDEDWLRSVPILTPRPRPGHSVGFKRTALTGDQRRNLQPYLAGTRPGEASYFMGTNHMLFPFMSCEVKSSLGSLEAADGQKAHNMMVAIRGIAELFRALKRDCDVDRRILGFSVFGDSHCTVPRS